MMHGYLPASDVVLFTLNKENKWSIIHEAVVSMITARIYSNIRSTIKPVYNEVSMYNDHQPTSNDLSAYKVTLIMQAENYS